MGVVRVLKRDIGSLFAISRNIGEGKVAKCKRCFWGAVYLCKAVRIGVRSMFSEQLGSRVTYEGRECFVSNWAAGESPTLSDGNGWYQEHCERSKIVNKRGMREAWHRFEVGFGWYMGSWYTIDVQNRVHP